jgi:hypothetical protein
VAAARFALLSSKMNAQSEQVWNAIEIAKSGFLKWAASNDIAVYCVEYVPNTPIEIYVFFPTNKDLQQHKETGRLQAIKAHYRQLLAEAQYPQERFPVYFYFDSHENVVKNHKGSYFYRLR